MVADYGAISYSAYYLCSKSSYFDSILGIIDRFPYVLPGLIELVLAFVRSISSYVMGLATVRVVSSSK